MDLIKEIEEAVRRVIREEIENIQPKTKSEWITKNEAMQIMDCTYQTVWLRASSEKSIRIKKVSDRKTLYFREDCEKRKESKTYRYPIL